PAGLDPRVNEEAAHACLRGQPIDDGVQEGLGRRGIEGVENWVQEIVDIEVCAIEKELALRPEFLVETEFVHSRCGFEFLQRSLKKSLLPEYRQCGFYCLVSGIQLSTTHSLTIVFY